MYWNFYGLARQFPCWLCVGSKCDCSQLQDSELADVTWRQTPASQLELAIGLRASESAPWPITLLSETQLCPMFQGSVLKEWRQKLQGLLRSRLLCSNNTTVQLRRRHGKATHFQGTYLVIWVKGVAAGQSIIVKEIILLLALPSSKNHIQNKANSSFG